MQKYTKGGIGFFILLKFVLFLEKYLIFCFVDLQKAHIFALVPLLIRDIDLYWCCKCS